MNRIGLFVLDGLFFHGPGSGKLGNRFIAVKSWRRSGLGIGNRLGVFLVLLLFASVLWASVGMVRHHGSGQWGRSMHFLGPGGSGRFGFARAELTFPVQRGSSRLDRFFRAIALGLMLFMQRLSRGS